MISYFQVTDEWILMADGEKSVSLLREQFQALEPQAQLPPIGTHERWTPDLHFLLNPDQVPAPDEFGDRPLYIERIESYLTVLDQHDVATTPPESSPINAPNWQQFRAQMLMHSAYLRIVGRDSTTQTLNAALVWMLGEIGNNPAILGDVANTWNAIASIAEPTADEIRSLNQIGEVCQVPFRLNLNGFMVTEE
ncbi:MAG TPA: hypothetical protein ACFE0H_11160 [Elainellaceae cyanobacterium]